MVLQASGCEVHQYGRHPAKLAVAEACGVRTSLASELPKASYDWVVEATGSPEGLTSAVAMTRPMGTIVMKSTVHGTVSLDTAAVIVNELTLVGSRCGRFEPALELLQKGALNLTEMVADRFPLREAPRAFERAAERGVLKVLLMP
jgi:threonine dehydrogenase-like Zn-dependent dehydrogenase